MKVILKKAPMSGEMTAPASKSMAHRALIAAALSKGTSVLKGLLWSEDLKATARILSSFGANIQIGSDTAKVQGIEKRGADDLIADAGESASTLRFLMPVGLALHKTVLWKGHGRLPERPLTAALKLGKEKGISFSSHHLPFWLTGTLRPGTYTLSGKESSQYFSGLFMALPLLEGDSKVIAEGTLESAPYADMTRQELKKHGIRIEKRDSQTFLISGRQTYRPVSETIEGDYSAAAFWLAMGLLGESVVVKNLAVPTCQGDGAITSMIRSLNGAIETVPGGWKTTGSALQGTTISLEQNPDLLPVLAALGAVSEGTTHLIHAERARWKESDRIHVMAEELAKLGAHIEENEDGLTIHGKKMLRGGAVSSHGDHRITMALSILRNKCEAPIVISHAECVSKSDPDYWTRYERAGGQLAIERGE
jgi:3-phosphoshikimate 1-carboxyvinyltransferase